MIFRKILRQSRTKFLNSDDKSDKIKNNITKWKKVKRKLQSKDKNILNNKNKIN